MQTNLTKKQSLKEVFQARQDILNDFTLDQLDNLIALWEEQDRDLKKINKKYTKLLVEQDLANNGYFNNI